MKRESVLIAVVLAVIVAFSAVHAYSGADQITEITLERGPCGRGRCPDYKVILRSDGTATYIGKRNVAHIGQYTGRVDFDQLKKLLESKRFFDLKDKYGNAADYPIMTTSAVRNGNRKTVVTSYEPEAPIELRDINSAIDGVALQISWTQ